MRFYFFCLALLSGASCTIEPSSCANLYQISTNTERLESLWGELIDILKNDPMSFVDDVSLPKDTVFAKNAKDGFGFDWSKWGMNIENATLGWNGIDDVDNFQFSIDNLKYVAIGYGRRDKLTFELREPESSPEARQHLESYMVSVLCSSVPRLLIDEKRYRTELR